MILVGLLLIADSLFVMTRSSWTLGVMMPLVMGVPLLLIGLFLPGFKKLCKKSRFIRVLLFLVSLCYLLFCILFCVTTGLILANSTEPDGGADALIVLGGGIRGDQPTLTLKYRLDAAKGYLDRNPDTVVIVSGGQGPDEAVSEAEVMKNYLIRAGIDEGRIIMEDKSESTEENFRFSKRIIDERFGSGAKVVFATTRFHVFRSELVAKKEGVPSEGIPAKGVWYITFNDYLRECVGISLYFVTGKI